ncbi:MAG: deoxyhypusine synthase family protein, partial [Desulfobacterota bacterium]|nr:deoxyhypusine synthase family protein [Thermodesulfobacteriota bacterium]
MTKKLKPLSFGEIKTVSLKDRDSKVNINQFGKRYLRGATLAKFLEDLPQILGAKDLREIIERIVKAKKENHTIILGMGAHVIKVGLSPLIIQLMEEGVVQGIALNGAGAIHDVEIALAGKTSEEVEIGLNRGEFGMAEETATFINQGVSQCRKSHLGLGEGLGKKIESDKLPYRHMSILAQGEKLRIPVTVHVAFGTDIVHLHPNFNPAAWGEATYLDFRYFCALVATLEKGVYLNVGSAVILPEIFLKALTVVRNQGYQVEHFTTINMDFTRHSRPQVNVVDRP